MIKMIKDFIQKKKDERAYEEQLRLIAIESVKQQVEEKKIQTYAKKYEETELKKLEGGSGLKGLVDKLGKEGKSFISSVKPDDKLNRMLGKSKGVDRIQSNVLQNLRGGKR
jgi:hypothetical protein